MIRRVDAVGQVMKLRYLLMALVMVSTFDGASFALSRGKMVAQPALVQPQAEMRGTGEGAIELSHWVRWSSKLYQMRQKNLR
jgi:hypothetical protein